MNMSVDWQDQAGEAMERDPRTNPYGYLTGGSFVLDSTRVFVWFPSMEELAKQILEVEPRVYDLEPGDGLEDYQARVAPLTAELLKDGFSDELLMRLNESTNDNFAVDWWGIFKDLMIGEGEFEKDTREGFLGESRSHVPITAQEIDGFIEYLKSCYC